MKLTLRKSEWLDDWYVIERAEHDGREWLEPIEGVPNGLSFQKSSRLGNADIEGTADEMLAIATAIEKGESVSFKRCAAYRTDDGYLLSSPRNTINPTLVPFDDAKELAVEIRGQLATVGGVGR